MEKKQRARALAILFLLAAGGAAIWGFIGLGVIGSNGLGFQKGISYTAWSNDGYLSPGSFRSIERAKKTGANALSVLVTWYQADIDSKNIKRMEMTPSDEAVVAAIRQAHKLGMKVMLKPHLDLLNTSSGSWRGEIGQVTEEGWKEWFANYTAFIMYYAAIAKKEKVELYCVGNELTTAATTKGYLWSELIAKVREVYPGALTYASHWDSYQDIRFWKELDYIGINAYFPLTKEQTPSYEQLIEGWGEILPGIEEFQKKMDMPVIFPEVGCKSCDGAAIRPWEHNPNGMRNLSIQADYYRALLVTFWNKEWFDGVYWWDWRTDPDFGGEYNRDFTPQNKPAEKVIAKWYTTPARQFPKDIDVCGYRAADVMSGAAPVAFLFSGGTAPSLKSGQLGVDNGELGEVTHVFISNADSLGKNIRSLLSGIMAGEMITLSAGDNSYAQATYRVTGRSDAGGYHDFNVVPVMSEGSFEDNEKLGIFYSGQGLTPGKYIFSSDTVSPPGPGLIELNNPDPVLATRIFIYDTDRDGGVTQDFLNNILKGRIVTLFGNDSSLPENSFLVTGISDMGAYHDLRVIPVFCEGAFEDKAKINLSYSAGEIRSAGYIFSESAKFPPDPGYIEINSDSLSAVTHLYISDTDMYLIPSGDLLNNISKGDLIGLYATNNSSAQMTYRVTGNIENGRYHDLSVIPVSAGDKFVDNSSVGLVYSGLGMTSMPYIFSSDISGAVLPVKGHISVDAPDLSSVKTVYVHDSVLSGTSAKRYLDNISEGDLLSLFAGDNTPAQATYRVVGATDIGEHYKFDVINVYSFGMFKEGAALSLTYSDLEITSLGYIFSGDTNVSTPPRTGYIKMNAPDLARSTNISVNNTDSGGEFERDYLAGISRGDLITLFAQEGSQALASYSLAGISDKGSYQSLDVIPVFSKGVFANNTGVNLTYSSEAKAFAGDITKASAQDVPSSAPVNVPPAADIPGFQRGMHFLTPLFDGYQSPGSDKSMSILRDNTGSNSISIPVVWERGPQGLARSENTSTNAAITQAVRKAHELGMNVILSLRLDGPLSWDKEPPSPTGASGGEWLERWFDDYVKFVLYYAELAKDENVQILSIGSGPSAPVTIEKGRWSDLIKKVREVYPGKLTYAAGWGDHDKAVFWDELDYIGINAIFPLTTGAKPVYEDFVAGWNLVLPGLESFQKGLDKPVIFSEAGCKSCNAVNIQPSEYFYSKQVDLDVQKDYYKALLAVFGPKKWFAGVYWWYWTTCPSSGGEYDAGFTPQNKPTETLLKETYKTL